MEIKHIEFKMESDFQGLGTISLEIQGELHKNL